jgi:phosphatidylserine/phosphatidylglycerophosphate/cardiolipin synthase-like enzyme
MTDTVHVTFLSQGEQQAADIARKAAEFIVQAQKTLDIAVYDMRLSDELRAILAGALRERADQGVTIRIAYDADKPEQPELDRGMDPSASGTGEFVQSLGYEWERIGGEKLMHHKYIVRDAGTPDASDWTGSTNFTNDSWTLQENNILTIQSQAIADWYAKDFAKLWKDGDFENSGNFGTEPVTLQYDGADATTTVLFSPGRGDEIDDRVAEVVAAASRRVVICSMLLNASALLKSLDAILDAGQVQVSGIYDRTQQESVLFQWEAVPQNHWKIPLIREIVDRAGLVGKNSTPYSPDTPHDFMHAKILVVDDTVITGSYNFSHSATKNAENILLIDSPALADTYAEFIAHLVQKYAPESKPL